MNNRRKLTPDKQDDNDCYKTLDIIRGATRERWTRQGNSSHPCKEISPAVMRLYNDEQNYLLTNAINQTSHKLQQCGWYYPKMTKETAKNILQKRRAGCFLLRQSSDSIRNYTISVKTSVGVVSIRILASQKESYVSFRLDCSKRLTNTVVEESCVVDLVQQLVDTKALDVYRFSDNKGQSNISLQLQTPVNLQPSSLKHLARLALHKHTLLTKHKSLPTDKLPIPNSLKEYISEYAHTV